MIVLKAEREKLRNVMVQNYHDTKVREHQKILQRHKIIEDRKEYIERLNTVREEEEQKRLVVKCKILNFFGLKIELYRVFIKYWYEFVWIFVVILS